MSIELYQERPFIWCFGEAHWSEQCHIRPLSAYIVSFVNTDQWASPKHHMKGHSRYNSSLTGRKFENGGVSRNGHRIKLTLPNSMILVSISSAEDALFKDVKSCQVKYMTLLDHRVLNICRSAFFGTPGVLLYISTLLFTKHIHVKQLTTWPGFVLHQLIIIFITHRGHKMRHITEGQLP